MAQPTGRPIAPGLEVILGDPFPVLNHGFIRVVDYMGDDDAIVQAARVSFNKGTDTPEKDAALIHYLMAHRHTTPFEMCQIKFHLKMPIFVARQWVRHRMASINEQSARYSVLDREFYLPTVETLGSQSTSNKQGTTQGAFDKYSAKIIIDAMEYGAEQAFADYNNFLDPAGTDMATDDRTLFIPGVGVSREQARINLPLSTYTQFYWKVDLHNLFHFEGLRADPHAQFEIRVYADIILRILQSWVPVAHAAFMEHRFNARTFSATEMRAMLAMLARHPDDLIEAIGVSHGLKGRMLAGFKSKLGITS